MTARDIEKSIKGIEKRLTKVESVIQLPPEESTKSAMAAEFDTGAGNDHEPELTDAELLKMAKGLEAELEPYWVTYTDHYSRCIEAYSELAVYREASLIGQIKSVKRLPYPAVPRASPKISQCPAFCFMPHECQGRTACPRNPSCTS